MNPPPPHTNAFFIDDLSLLEIPEWGSVSDDSGFGLPSDQRKRVLIGRNLVEETLHEKEEERDEKINWESAAPHSPMNTPRTVLRLSTMADIWCSISLSRQHPRTEPRAWEIAAWMVLPVDLGIRDWGIEEVRSEALLPDLRGELNGLDNMVIRTTTTKVPAHPTPDLP